MIYRGIVEKIIDPYTVKVRVPLVHRTTATSQHVDLDSLPDAKICTLPNTHPNIQVGDIIVVAFENNDLSKPMIIGYLYKEVMSDTAITSKLNTLEVKFGTILSEDTTIGNVTPKDISNLYGTKENIQQQINQILNRLDMLESK